MSLMKLFGIPVFVYGDERACEVHSGSLPRLLASIGVKADLPPGVHLCEECYARVRREFPELLRDGA